jgi:hypothetical protein
MRLRVRAKHLHRVAQGRGYVHGQPRMVFQILPSDCTARTNRRKPPGAFAEITRRVCSWIAVGAPGNRRPYRDLSREGEDEGCSAPSNSPWFPGRPQLIRRNLVFGHSLASDGPVPEGLRKAKEILKKGLSHPA